MDLAAIAAMATIGGMVVSYLRAFTHSLRTAPRRRISRRSVKHYEAPW